VAEPGAQRVCLTWGSAHISPPAPWRCCSVSTGQPSCSPWSRAAGRCTAHRLAARHTTGRTRGGDAAGAALARQLPVGTVIPPTTPRWRSGRPPGTDSRPVARFARHAGGHPVRMVAIPLGQFGRYADRRARQATILSPPGRGGRRRRRLPEQIEWLHLSGTGISPCPGGHLYGHRRRRHAAALPLAPLLIGAVRETGLSLQYSFTLIGAAMLLAHSTSAGGCCCSASPSSPPCWSSG